MPVTLVVGTGALVDSVKFDVETREFEGPPVPVEFSLSESLSDWLSHGQQPALLEELPNFLTGTCCEPVSSKNQSPD